jgi:ammonium transporter, Amt family
MKKLFLCLGVVALLAPALFGNESPVPTAAPGETAAAAPAAIDSGDTAWMITATALVLFMTLPGLALFYGGLVRAKNVLSVLV